MLWRWAVCASVDIEVKVVGIFMEDPLGICSEGGQKLHAHHGSVGGIALKVPCVHII